MGLDILGIGSGMDIKAMVKAIADSELAPREAALKRQEARAESELSTLGKLFGAGGELLQACQSLQDIPLNPEEPISHDIQALKTGIDGFIHSCNKFLKIARLAGSGNGKEGLPGNSAVRSLTQQLGRLLGQAHQPDAKNYRTLADIGLVRRRDSSLSLDQTAFARALRSFPSEVQELISSGQGAMAKIAEFIQSMDNPGHGLQLRGNTLERDIQRFSSEHVSLDLERQKITDRLLRKYIDMDQRVGQLKQVGTSIEQLQSTLLHTNRTRP